MESLIADCFVRKKLKKKKKRVLGKSKILLLGNFPDGMETNIVLKLKQIGRKEGKGILWWVICQFWIKTFLENVNKESGIGLILVE